MKCSLASAAYPWAAESFRGALLCFIGDSYTECNEVPLSDWDDSTAACGWRRPLRELGQRELDHLVNAVDDGGVEVGGAVRRQHLDVKPGDRP